MYKFIKQNYYDVPVDNLFLVELLDDNQDYMNLIGYEFIIDFTQYKVITIMTDIPTKKIFALCKELPQQEN